MEDGIVVELKSIKPLKFQIKELDIHIFILPVKHGSFEFTPA
jgi:hypothetical protein